MSEFKRRKYGPLRALAAVPAISLAMSGCIESEKTHEEIIREDLLIIIDELGSPCGRVVDHELKEELAYTVKCESGHIYSISVNPEGRVTIE